MHQCTVANRILFRCSIEVSAVVQKLVPYSHWYLFNAIPGTNHKFITLTLLTLIVTV